MATTVLDVRRTEAGQDPPVFVIYQVCSEYFFTILTVVSPYCSRVAVQSRLCSGVPVLEGRTVTPTHCPARPTNLIKIIVV